jgi:sugar lactone lactonase YvrE
MDGELISGLECVSDYPAQTGESPTWSRGDQALYWIDIDQPALHRFDPRSGEDRHWMLPDQVGCFALDDYANRALLGLRSGLYELSLRSGALRRLALPPFDPELFRFNDGGCDNRGRFWLGVMSEPKSGTPAPPAHSQHLFRNPWHSYLASEGLRAHADSAIVPNGLAWSPDYRILYLSHSRSGRIYSFNYEPHSGYMSNRWLFAVIPSTEGVPDGGTVDAEGCYWSALHGGGRLRRFRPDGSVDRDVELPVSRPTKCAFGGKDLDVLYITSASGHMTDEDRRREPWAGRLLRARARVRGCPSAGFSMGAAASARQQNGS